MKKYEVTCNLFPPDSVSKALETFASITVQDLM